MTNKKDICREEAVHEIKNQAGTKFDPDIVEIFITKVEGKDTKENL